jgi:hypothetical protein
MGKNKADDAVKRPRSGYILFTMDKRDSVKAAEPGIVNKEIMKRLAEKWKALSEAEKKVYNAKAAKEKDAYRAQKPASGKKDKKAGKKDKKDKKSSKKKAPVDEEEDSGE